MPDSSSVTLRLGWMVAGSGAKVSAVGPRVELDVDLTGDSPSGADIASGLARAVPGSAPPADAPEVLRHLVAQLEELGAFGPATVSPTGTTLAEAIDGALRGVPPSGSVWTAEELLWLPEGLSVTERTQAIRAFVGGIGPDARLLAYAQLADGHGRVFGDVPDPEQAQRAAAAVPGDPRTVAVIELAQGGRRWDVADGGVDRIGAASPHRLGPVRALLAPEAVVAELPDLAIALAEVSVANLGVPTSAADRRTQGVGTAEHASLVARAETVERYASSDPAGATIVEARHHELTDAIAPGRLHSRDPAEDAEAASRSRLWTPAVARDGTQRWVPAETVFLTVRDPAPGGAALPWTSSGTAAHATVEAARERAFGELVERDAFVWTWLQRVSRERIRPEGASPVSAERARVLATYGWATTWVNLTLDSYPVVLCALSHGQRGLTIGAACDPEPGSALDRATVEALCLALRFSAEQPPPRPEDVRGPSDHVRLHRDPARAADHGFLFAGDDEIDLREIPSGHGFDLEQRLDDLGYPPLTVDLTTPPCAPFRVVRALAPGLLPMTFGWGTDPTGMLRARTPRTLTDGRRIGNSVIDPPLADRLPHPFP